MEQLGVMFEDTRDEEGLQRFIQHLPEEEYNSTSESFDTLRDYDYYPPATVLHFYYTFELKTNRRLFRTFETKTASL